MMTDRITKLDSLNKLIIPILVGVILISLPLVVRNPYWLHLCIMSLIFTILAMCFSILISTGLVTLGVSAFWGIGAYASTLLVVNLDLAFWVALPLAAMISGIFGLGLGSVIVRLPGFAFVISTMLFMLIFYQTAGQIEALGGWAGFLRIPIPDPITLGPHVLVEFTSRVACYYLILALFGLAALYFYALYSSRIGRAWRAISLSPNLAQAVGINVYRYRLLAFVISSATAGLAGSFYAHYLQAISPFAFGGFISVYIQLYAVLGGITFYILGPLVGASIMTFMVEGFRIAGDFQLVVSGILLVTLILFFPGGILGTIQRFQSLKSGNNTARIRAIGRGLRRKTIGDQN